MILILDRDNDWLGMSLEPKDFVNEVGHKFIQELKLRLPDDNYITDNDSGIFLWIMDYTECIDIFIKCFKKYYPEKFKNQIIKVFWYEPKER